MRRGGSDRALMNLRAKEDKMHEVRAKRMQPSTKGYNVTVDCPMCGKEHRHSNVLDGEMRIASCALSDVPNHDGYVIRYTTPAGAV